MIMTFTTPIMCVCLCLVWFVFVFVSMVSGVWTSVSSNIVHLSCLPETWSLTEPGVYSPVNNAGWAVNCYVLFVFAHSSHYVVINVHHFTPFYVNLWDLNLGPCSCMGELWCLRHLTSQSWKYLFASTSSRFMG